MKSCEGRQGLTRELRVSLMLNGAEESHSPVYVSRTTLGLHGKLPCSSLGKRDAGLHPGLYMTHSGWTVAH